MRTFEGIRVIDFTQAIAGPFATYQLALQGAEVSSWSTRAAVIRGASCIGLIRICKRLAIQPSTYVRMQASAR
jgi:hypothetical protein